MKESKFEKKEEELNEGLKEIQEKAKLIKVKDSENRWEIISDAQRSKEYKEIRDTFPRTITNNELPEGFYKNVGTLGDPFGRFFARLELTGIYEYHKRTVDFLERVSKLRSLGLSPYKDNFDGKPLLEDNLFSDYTNKDRSKLLESNKELEDLGIDVIGTFQRLRLDFNQFKLDHDTYRFRLTIVHEIGHALPVFIRPDSKEKFSSGLLQKAEKLGRESKKEHPYERDIKKLFPEKKDEENHQIELTNIALDFAKQAITEIRQKMKENYEKQKK